MQTIESLREVESNITQMVMITKKVFKGEINILSLDGGLFLFRWNKIPGRDNWRLIKFLNQNYSIDWVKTAKIEKINGAETIKLFTDKNSLSIGLNDENTKVSLKIDAEQDLNLFRIARVITDNILIATFVRTKIMNDKSNCNKL